MGGEGEMAITPQCVGRTCTDRTDCSGEMEGGGGWGWVESFLYLKFVWLYERVSRFDLAVRR